MIPCSSLLNRSNVILNAFRWTPLKPRGMYRRLYGCNVEPAINVVLDSVRQIHGSAVAELCFQAGISDFNYVAEQLLTEMISDGSLEHFERPEPTHSQRAFIGLQYDSASYRKAGWAPGIKLHFYYRRPV